MMRLDNLADSAQVVQGKDFQEIHTFGNRMRKLASSRALQEDPVYHPGKWFIFTSSYPFYHLMMDAIAEYEYLKTQYEDIQLGVFSLGADPSIEEMLKKNSALKYIFDTYSPEVFQLDEQAHVFEHCISLTNLFDQRLSSNVDSGTKSGIVNYLNWDRKLVETNEKRVVLIDMLVKVMSERFSKDESLPKKIFSVRHNKPSSPTLVVPTTRDDPMFFSREYEGEGDIIRYFSRLGYATVDFGKLSFEDQIRHCMSATHIAGLKGSNLFNAIFAEPGCEVTQITACNWWGYTFEDYFLHRGHHVNDVGLFNEKKIISLAPSEFKKHTVEHLLSELQTINSL